MARRTIVEHELVRAGVLRICTDLRKVSSALARRRRGCFHGREGRAGVHLVLPVAGMKPCVIVSSSPFLYRDEDRRRRHPRYHPLALPLVGCSRFVGMSGPPVRFYWRGRGRGRCRCPLSSGCSPVIPRCRGWIMAKSRCSWRLFRMPIGGASVCHSAGVLFRSRLLWPRAGACFRGARSPCIEVVGCLKPETKRPRAPLGVVGVCVIAALLVVWALQGSYPAPRFPVGRAATTAVGMTLQAIPFLTSELSSSLNKHRGLHIPLSETHHIWVFPRRTLSRRC